MLSYIIQALINSYNKAPDKGKYTVQARSICPSYVKGTNFADRPVWESFEAAIQEGEAGGLFSATKNRDGNYNQVIATTEQIHIMAKKAHFVTVDQKNAALDHIMNSWISKLEPRAGVLHQWVEKEIVQRYPDCSRWWKVTVPKDLKIMEEELNRLIAVTQRILLLDSEIMVRNLSVQECAGSKEFAKTYESKVCHILAHERMEQKDDKSDILAEYNVVKNPSHVFLRGRAEIGFSNGSKLILDPDMGHVTLSVPMVNSISSIICPGMLLTIENLTTFHSYQLADNDLCACTMGQPNSAVVAFIRKYLDLTGKSVFDHYGDLDGFGFVIIETLYHRTGAKLVYPRHMDENTYRKHLKYGVPLNPRNGPILLRLLKSDLFDRRIKTVMDLILQENKLVEQESIEIDTSHA